MNAPIAPVNTTHRDGSMQMCPYGSARNYNPSHFNDYSEDKNAVEPPLHIVESELMAQYSHRDDCDDYYTQAGDLYRLMSAEQK